MQEDFRFAVRLSEQCLKQKDINTTSKHTAANKKAARGMKSSQCLVLPQIVTLTTVPTVVRTPITPKVFSHQRMAAKAKIINTTVGERKSMVNEQNSALHASLLLMRREVSLCYCVMKSLRSSRL